MKERNVLFQTLPAWTDTGKFTKNRRLEADQVEAFTPTSTKNKPDACFRMKLFANEHS
jgi:hypothetical protein